MASKALLVGCREFESPPIHLTILQRGFDMRFRVKFIEFRTESGDIAAKGKRDLGAKGDE